ncbi:MAG TPA: hypothetical protein VKA76_11795 [Gammaproteobacteria bacterium]|nr:hypothetical protein [Gammaproteobacteria bacterium]
MGYRRGLTIVLVLCLGLAGGGARAETARRGGDSAALAKAQYLLKQLSSAKAELQTKYDKLKAANDKLKAANAGLEKQLHGREQQLATSRHRNNALIDGMKKERQRLVDLAGRWRATVVDLHQTRQEKHRLQQELAQQRTAFQQCDGKNIKLYEANVDLLKRYADKGVMAALLQKEPVTGIKQVKVENILQEYREKLKRLRVEQLSGSADADSSSSTQPARAAGGPGS